MTDIFYQKWLKSKFKDLRKKEALQWFKDTYFVALYDSNDNYKNRIMDEYPDVLCISLAENVGFGRANNEGIRGAKGRNFFFLNPDTILLNDALTILSDYLDTHKNVGACGGNLYDENLSPSLSYRRILPSIVWEINDLLYQVPEKIFYRNNRRFNETGKPMKVAYITGADLMVKRETLIEVGLFSPSFLARLIISFASASALPNSASAIFFL